MSTTLRKILVLVFACYCLMANVQAQETYNTIELATPTSTSYILQVHGRMLPGFSMQATSGASYFIRANPNPPNSLSKNFQKLETVLVAGITQEAQLPSLTVTSKLTTLEYFDGLGRPEQTIAIEASPTLLDIIIPYEYDEKGRVAKSYLPFVKNNSIKGNFVSNGVIEQLTFYQTPPQNITGDTRPFSENVYDNTPFNRITKIYGQGQVWKTDDKYSTTTSTLNIANEVLRWNEYLSGYPSLSTALSGYYPANTLMVSISTTEDGQITKTYQNFRGQNVLTRTSDGINNLDTYYIYNMTGLLMYVIQPEGSARLATEYIPTGADKQSFLDRWSFQYKYDEYHQRIASKVPGNEIGAFPIGWTIVVYDQWNRVALTQEPNQQSTNEYHFVKYDRFNRPILTGVFATTTSLSALRTNAFNSSVRFESEAASTPTGYTLTASYPTSVTESNLLTVTYYDNYDFLYSGWDAEGNSYGYVNISGFPQKTATESSEIMTAVKGFKTGSKIRVLSSSLWLNSVIYYDKKYRTTQTISESHVGGTVRITNKSDFSGKIEKTEYVASNAGINVLENYTYDHFGRLQTVTHSINGATPVLMVSNRYNELGQLIEENIHSTNSGGTFLQSIDKSYNIRGWLTNINNSSLTAETGDNNNDLFGMQVEYNPATVSAIGSFTTKKVYSGNLSAIKWKIDNKKDSPIEKIYGYEYDGVNRLRHAYFAQKNGSVWTTNVGMFDEEIKGYDRNGNIKGAPDPLNPGVPSPAVVRYGNVQGSKVTIDNLSFSYSLNNKESNRLIGVNDSGNSIGFKDAAAGVTEEYIYDKNGNLTFDHNKSISLVEYNILDLPKTVEFTRPGGSIDKVEYVYDALGTKLKKTIKINGVSVWVTDYVGGLQYDNGKLSFFATPKGRVTVSNNEYDYEYFLKDYVNNVRVVYGSFKETKTYRATMEIQLASQEEDPLKEGFKNVNARRLNPGNTAHNITKSFEQVVIPDRSAWCNANNGTAIGPAKSLRVLNGDAVYMEAYAKYTQATGSNAVITAAVLGSAINSAFGIVSSGETATLYGQINANAAVASGVLPAGTVQPKAYLVYLFFDDNYIYQRSGAVGISTAAFNQFEKLTRSFTADKNGYLYIYVASESNVAAANVYFDEVYVVHRKTNDILQVVQSSDFYPFGLSFNEYQSDRLYVSEGPPVNSNYTYKTILRNRYQFQGYETQKDLDLNWYDAKARMYDAALGKFLSIDPLAEKTSNYTPYHFVLNNPAVLIDPTGTTHSWNPSNYNYLSAPQFTTYQSNAIQNSYNRQAVYGVVVNKVKDYYTPYSNSTNNKPSYFDPNDAPKAKAWQFLQTFANAATTAFPFIDNLAQMSVATVQGKPKEAGKQAALYGLNAAVIPAVAEFAVTRIAAWVAPKFPLGFTSYKQFQQAGDELRIALNEAGISYNSIGVQGSSVTGFSSKGGPFRFEAQNGLNVSDIDAYIDLTFDIGLGTSKNIPGMVHPAKMMKNYPSLQVWSDTWSQTLGRPVTPAAFTPNYWPTYGNIAFP